MATTFTTRLLLRKPDPDPSTGDFINVVTDINNSMDKLDAVVGATVCTSGTRPTGADRWDGRQIYETDTRRTYMWSAALTAWLPMLIGRGTDGPYLLGQSTDTGGEGFNVRGSVAGAEMWRSRVTTDANPRYVFTANGAMAWGPGNVAADLTFGRTSAGVATLGGNLSITGNTTITGSATVGGVPAVFGDKTASVIGASGTKTNSTVTAVAGTASIAFVKKVTSGAGGTNLAIRGSMSCYSQVGSNNPVVALWAMISGVTGAGNYKLGHFLFNPTQSHQHFTGEAEIPGLGAGTATCTLGWSMILGTGGFTVDTSDWLTLNVREVPV